MKDAYGWVACDHLGDVLGVEYVRLTRQEAQRVAVGHTQKTWRQLRARGWRCQPVVITPR